ncbi:hypothetical protein ACWT_5168 [Actinoplanes sp. SE50]|nr:hypothetical protein ACPL_5298 [Actinoplanes sp. SE50/110]ATO84583.1 hypothetical protein ACWT_5168 [Actinoplanes sp. SE50]SLM01993.1 hypothetical protein ACSP50_5231 [Actinoplanes sp. SE50/110]
MRAAARRAALRRPTDEGLTARRLSARRLTARRLTARRLTARRLTARRLTAGGPAVGGGRLVAGGPGAQRGGVGRRAVHAGGAVAAVPTGFGGRFPAGWRFGRAESGHGQATRARRTIRTIARCLRNKSRAGVRPRPGCRRGRPGVAARAGSGLAAAGARKTAEPGFGPRFPARGRPGPLVGAGRFGGPPRQLRRERPAGRLPPVPSRRTSGGAGQRSDGGTGQGSSGGAGQRSRGGAGQRSRRGTGQRAFGGAGEGIGERVGRRGDRGPRRECRRRTTGNRSGAERIRNLFRSGPGGQEGGLPGRRGERDPGGRDQAGRLGESGGGEYFGGGLPGAAGQRFAAGGTAGQTLARPLTTGVCGEHVTRGARQHTIRFDIVRRCHWSPPPVRAEVRATPRPVHPDGWP